MRGSARRSLAATIIAALVLAVALLPAAQAMYPRPKSAPAVNVSLVPAFNVCTPANSQYQHGPPLDDPSCSPPVPSSTAVTVGTPENNAAGDNSVANLKLSVKRGIPGQPEDSDVLVRASVSDVRCIGDTTTCGSTNAADGADYTGALQIFAAVRITDRWNGVTAGGGTAAATVLDFPLPVRFTCASTADVDMGGLCTANTSVDAVVPTDSVRDGKRSVWALSQAVINDGGPDGDMNTAPNTTFLRQGVFVP